MIVVGAKPCLFSLDLLKRSIVLLEVWIPSNTGIFKFWANYGCVGSCLNVFWTIPKVPSNHAQNFTRFPRNGCDMFGPLQVFIQLIINPDRKYIQPVPVRFHKKTYFLCGGTFLVEIQIVSDDVRIKASI